MKRQRSKAELLSNIRTYEALKKDAKRDKSISGNTCYWRIAVEWCTALWKEEKFSTNELTKFLLYIRDNGVTELSDARREELQQVIKDRCVDWVIKTAVNPQIMKNEVDQAINNIESFNSRAIVDYSLLACEYLIKHKGYGKKRLDRVISNVYYLENIEAAIIWEMRQELFDSKKIWIELGEDEINDDAEII